MEKSSVSRNRRKPDVALVDPAVYVNDDLPLPVLLQQAPVEAAAATAALSPLPLPLPLPPLTLLPTPTSLIHYPLFSTLFRSSLFVPRELQPPIYLELTGSKCTEGDFRASSGRKLDTKRVASSFPFASNFRHWVVDKRYRDRDTIYRANFITAGSTAREIITSSILQMGHHIRLFTVLWHFLRRNQ
ncbi:hypothetical protein V1477_009325 [Vespula maculifrons]|uniref:Uncharacterized protein n=1 Tax=Vespula maculifrons TaxID=7453 RepID=A0ABD2C9G4_VESMC